jgi:hypothetical protein
MTSTKTTWLPFKVTICVFKGRTFLCPESDLKEGEQVAIVQPIKKVDPKGIYVYVVDSKGQSHSVSKASLAKLWHCELRFERHQFDTHNMEISRQIKAVGEYLAAGKEKSS